MDGCAGIRLGRNSLVYRIRTVRRFHLKEENEPEGEGKREGRVECGMRKIQMLFVIFISVASVICVWRCIIRAEHNGHVVINAIMPLMCMYHTYRVIMSLRRKVASLFADRETLEIQQLFRFSLSLYISFFRFFSRIILPLLFLDMKPFLLLHISSPFFAPKQKLDALVTNESRRMKILDDVRDYE